ncbi:putative holin-like toxin [Paenibacillus polymyxa]
MTRYEFLSLLIQIGMFVLNTVAVVVSISK